MKYISDSIAQILGEQGVISREDIDKCRYGLEIFLSSASEVLSILLISAFVDNFFETVIFFAFFIPLRIYAGGYHADTKIRCYLVSLIVYGLFTIILDILPLNMIVELNIAEVLFSVIVILISAPCVHINKKLNIKEIKHFRKISIDICILQSVIILLLTIMLKNNFFTASMALGQLAETLSIVAAKLKDKIIENK